MSDQKQNGTNNPRAVLLRLKSDNPQASVEELAKLMMRETRSCDELLRPILVECLTFANEEAQQCKRHRVDNAIN